MRGLVHRVEEHLEQLTPAERDDITTAISAVRRTHQVISLGMPAIKGQPDLSVGLERR